MRSINSGNQLNMRKNIHKRIKKKYYRLAHIKTGQGLWYNSQGEFTGLIHNEFNFCKNNSLPMPFDPKIVGWLSAVETLEDLFNWFPKEDILILENYGYFITEYRAKKVRKYKNHLIICQKTSIVNKRICVDSII